ncbi:MAG: glycoside hydrolase family 5 protein [Promicromonosporaceae bacterium]|nr:glycoside hydrolase family 5 protein [Promicromonosporaceae bacterium]
MPEPSPLLHVDGDHLADAQGTPVRLTGFGLGGWMNMENFITGFPATEQQHREALRREMGDEAYAAFFDAFLADFFSEDDARYIASLGVNCVRIAVNYRHFEDDARPTELKDEGFRLLDRAIDACAAHGVYTVIDLHAVPGAQNKRWHSDNPTHLALLWRYREFQDRVVHLWEAFADRYKDNPWVAGYNPLNEPSDDTGEALEPFYARLRDAIRAIDPHHVIFLDGNRHGTAFGMFAEPWENTVYTLHDYALAGFPDSGSYPGYSRGEWVDAGTLEKKFLERSEYMRRTGTPIWVGEFGPVYTGDPARDEHRYRVLSDQLDLYDRHGGGWSLWTYKDIGLQGVRYADPGSAYLRLIDPVLRKKARLGVDVWGSTDEGLRDILEPLQRRVAQEFPDFDPAPWGQKPWVQTLVRHILFAEPLVDEFARLFRGVGPDEARALAGAFAFDRTVERTRLAETLRAHAAAPAREGARA